MVQIPARVAITGLIVFGGVILGKEILKHPNATELWKVSAGAFEKLGKHFINKLAAQLNKEQQALLKAKPV